MKIAGPQDPLDQPEEERRAELVLDQAGQADRDDEEEADREQPARRRSSGPRPSRRSLPARPPRPPRAGRWRRSPAPGSRSSATRRGRRRRGSPAARQSRWRCAQGLSGSELISIWPSGVRTATAQTETPRIITPSSTAWPPTGASRLATSAPSGMRSGSAPLRTEAASACRAEPTVRAHVLPPGLGVLRGAALEALDPATGVDQLLLAGVEGVALGAELDVQVRPWSSACRTGSRTSSARWRACTRGGFLPSSPPSLDDARAARFRLVASVRSADS